MYKYILPLHYNKQQINKVYVGQYIQSEMEEGHYSYNPF